MGRQQGASMGKGICLYLSSIPGPQWWGERTDSFLQVIFSPGMGHVRAYTHTHTQEIFHSTHTLMEERWM